MTPTRALRAPDTRPGIATARFSRDRAKTAVTPRDGCLRGVTSSLWGRCPLPLLVEAGPGPPAVCLCATVNPFAGVIPKG